MKEKTFKPILAVDATKNLKDLKYPKLASYKLDGIRCVFHPDLGMVSRSFKQIPNKQLQEKFTHVLVYAKKHNLILDGELYSHDLTFQEITRACMTKDFNDEKTLKKIRKEFNDDFERNSYIENLLDKIQFHCFETDQSVGICFKTRHSLINVISQAHKNVIAVKQIEVNSAEEVQELFKKVLADGYEGLILRCPNSPYKFGRSTLREEFMLKVKPFESFDGKILGVVQATKVRAEAVKKTNELGRSVTSRLKEDRVLVNKACAFRVMYEGKELKVSLAMTDSEKEEVWENRDKYIGMWIEYKGMLVGAKDVPRHPIMIRFREPKE